MPPSTRPLVVVVDDNPDMRETVGMIIETRGFDVILARNGRDAIDQVRLTGLRPSAIILDLNMPVMGGREFLAAQMHEPLLRDAHVVITTASQIANERWPESVCAVLQKPAPLSVLLAALQSACRGPLPAPPSQLARGTGVLPDVTDRARKPA